MEVAPQELAQLLKLAGVGASPEPDMPEPEMASEPEVSVMAIPSDDGAPVGGGCGAPKPEHDHGDMRSIIDMLKGGGEEPIEEAPPKDDYENASNEFTGHPVDVVDTYDQYSYEPAKNSGMQRRTNSYGDNPLREEDLIKEYAEFKEYPLFEVNWNNQDEVEAEYERLGLDQGDDPLGGWWDTQGMSDLQIRKAREDRIKQAYKNNEVDKQQADFGRGSEGEAEGAAVAAATAAKQQAAANRQAEIDRQKEGEADAIAQLQDPDSAAAQQQHKQALDNLGNTTIAKAGGPGGPGGPPPENQNVVAGSDIETNVPHFAPDGSIVRPNLQQKHLGPDFPGGSKVDPGAGVQTPVNDPAKKAGFNLNPNVSPSSPAPVAKPVAKKTVLKPPQLRKNVVSSKYGDGLDRLKILAGI